MWADSFGESDDIVFYVFCAVSAVILVVAIGVIVMNCIVKATTPGSSMDFYIAFGGLAIVVTVLLRGVNPKWSNDLGIEIACQFYVSLLVFGLLWFIGGIMIRCCAIYDFYKHKEEKLVSRTEWKPNLWMVLLMIIDGVLILVWVIVFRLQTEPDPTIPDVYICRADHKAKWEIALSVIHAVYIIIAAMLVWFAVAVSKKTPDITNATILAVITYNLLCVAIAGTLIYFLYEPDYDIIMTSKYAIIGGLELYVILFTFILLLFAKIVAARRAGRGEYRHGKPPSVHNSDVYEEAHSNRNSKSYAYGMSENGSVSRSSNHGSINLGSLNRGSNHGSMNRGSINRAKHNSSGSINRNSRSSANQFNY